jgi:hypothetical protein
MKQNYIVTQKDYHSNHSNHTNDINGHLNIQYLIDTEYRYREQQQWQKGFCDSMASKDYYDALFSDLRRNDPLVE